MDNERTTTRGKSGLNITGIVMRLIASAIVLAVTAFLTPGFTINGIWPLVAAVVVLTIMDYLFVKLLGIEASPFGRGIVGFISAALIIYLTQYFVTGYSVTVLAAIIGAIVYGIVDYLIPGDEIM